MREAARNEHKGACHSEHIAGQSEAYTKTSLCAKVNIPLSRTKMWQSKFLVWLWFWGYLDDAPVLNLEPLSACAIKTAHIPESNEEEVR